jgi:Uma2 family endonuclease
MASLQVLPRELITGQCMSREEFLSRWEALPDLKNAELIEGIVYVASPVSRKHGTFDTLTHWWLGHYVWHTPGCEAGNNATWFMLESAPQPDAYLVILPECGGQARGDDEYWEGAPDLALEICITSTEVDFGPKLALYQRAGVREYITLESLRKRIVWRVLVRWILRRDSSGCRRSLPVASVPWTLAECHCPLG